MQATHFFQTHDNPRMGKLRFPGAAVRIDGRALPARMAPRLGEHTEEVLTELGITWK